ncbi:MAG: hypothetical protein SPK70_10670 [Succinivibrio dextrinosolvens]|nr:hypothetical protein [Succinivibrio dextrinosolvens]MDY6471518.1 hypothetical protein [Succinivibrio dextrinosolvens]
MSFYIAVILAVVIIDYILLRFLMAALSKVVGAKIFKALRSTLDQVIVIDNKELSEEIKEEILTSFKNKMETDRNVSKEDLDVIFKH